MRYPRLKQRPPHFRLNPAWHPLKQGLVFAGLGNHPGSVRYEDSSIWKNTGTLTNMEAATDWVWVPELGRWGLDFDGSDDNILGPTSASLSPVDAISVSFWAYFTNLASVPGLVGLVSKGYWEQTLGWEIYLSRTSVIQLGHIAMGSGQSSVWSSQVLATNRWYHFTGTIAFTTVTVFLGGVQDNSGGVNTLTASTENLLIGKRHSSAHQPLHHVGQLSDVMVWRRILSPAEISALADPSNAMLEVGNCPLILPPRRRLFPAAAIAAGQPMMRRWGGIPHMTPGPVLAGRSW